MKTCLLIALLLVTPLLHTSAVAQSTGESDTWRVISALPRESDLGPNWIRIGIGELTLTDGAFIDGISAVFAGAVGSQLTIIVLEHDRGPSAAGQAWDAAKGWQDQALSEAVAIDSSTWQGESDHARPYPMGVVDALRVEGIDAWSRLPVGAGLYAFEPDVVALIVLEGRIHPDVQRTGVDAIDYIAALIAIRSEH